MADELPPLTDKQAKFVEEYLIDLNATQAAIRAGYSEKSAGTIGTENMLKPSIQFAIRQRQQELKKSTEITQERILKEESCLAYSDLKDLLNEDGTMIPPHQIPEELRRAISSVEVIERWIKGAGDEPEREVKYKYRFWDKGRSLERISRHLGMYPTPGSKEHPLEVNVTVTKD